MTATTFTAVTPNQTGNAVTFTAASNNGAGDLIPVSPTAMTVVLVQNTDAGGAHTVTFTSQPDEWGNTGASLNKTVSVPLSSTVAVQLSPPSRWAASTVGTCIITYAAYSDMNIAVLNVPWQSV